MSRPPSNHHQHNKRGRGNYHNYNSNHNQQQRNPRTATSSSSSSSAVAAAADISAWSTDSRRDFLTDQQLLTPHTGDRYALHVIDGSLLEGGGQVLRSATTYSALFHLPIHVTHIRAGRASGGGLKLQHLTGIKLCHEMTGGKLKHAEIGSTEIVYEPGKGNYQFATTTSSSSSSTTPSAVAAAGGRELQYVARIESAGATGLLIQVALPIALFMPYPVHMTLSGGTNAAMAPLYDYTNLLYIPTLKKLWGVQVEMRLERRGFFPRGGGTIHLTTQPITSILPPITLTIRGPIVEVRGLLIVTADLPASLLERMVVAATKELRSHALLSNTSIPINLTTEHTPSSQSGSSGGGGLCLLLYAVSGTGCWIGASEIGERRQSVEEVASRCAKQLIANIDAGGCVDEYMQDQLIMWLVLCGGQSRMKTGPLTMHTRTCLYWARSFAPQCEIEVHKAKDDAQYTESTDTDQTYIISVRGIGYTSQFKSA